jgi:hypothetical protein
MTVVRAPFCARLCAVLMIEVTTWAARAWGHGHAVADAVAWFCGI